MTWMPHGVGCASAQIKDVWGEAKFSLPSSHLPSREGEGGGSRSNGARCPFAEFLREQPGLSTLSAPPPTCDPFLETSGAWGCMRGFMFFLFSATLDGDIGGPWAMTSAAEDPGHRAVDAGLVARR